MVVLVFFFIWETKKSGRWSSYTVTIVWEFAWADPVLVVLDECSSYRGGRLNRFDCGLLLTYTLVVFTSNQLCNAIFYLTLNDPRISESCIKIKIKLNVCFLTSLWCLERFCEGL